MALYVRHTAWLNAVPQREGKSDLPPNKASRRKTLEVEGVAIEMPPLDCEYLIGYLFDIGPTMAAGMGNGPVTYSEIEAWQRISGVTLLPWEASLIRRLSGEYAAESFEAGKQDRPPPFKEGRSLQTHTTNQSDRNLERFLA